MNYKAFFLLGVFALLPIHAYAHIDCRDTRTGCTVAQLIEISNQTFLTKEDRISILQQAIAMLTEHIAQLSANKKDTTTGTCVNLNNPLVIGSTDATTGGEVSKLQEFLAKTGYFGNPNDQTGLSLQSTGYYGTKTANAVVRWQKAHGMDFVTTASGVGPMTREKMRCNNEKSSELQ